MLRLLVFLLLLANGGYFAWSQGHLRSWGLGPAQQSEPQRLEQQIRPEALQLVSAEESRRLEAVAAVAAGPRPAECLATAALDEPMLTALRPVLEGWPPASWSLETVVEPGRWIVYMGKYLAADNVTRKKAELRLLGVSFEPLSNTTLEPGLSLGGFASQEAANQYLQKLTQRGVRTARVVQERAELRGMALRLPLVDDALRARIDELKPALAGRPLRPCRSTPDTNKETSP